MQIVRLEIGCKNTLKQQMFYSNVLGLDIFNQTENSFELHLGYSNLYFQEKEDFTPYHIAFHIPDNSEEDALNWLKDRLTVLNFEAKEIIDFPAWNAKSIYFYDIDKNIMEFISRRGRNGDSFVNFSKESILGISEMGLATSDIEKQYRYLNSECELSIYDGNFDKFCAIGDDEGLFITINSNKKAWFPTGDVAYNSEFKIQFIEDKLEYWLQYRNNSLNRFSNK